MTREILKKTIKTFGIGMLCMAWTASSALTAYAVVPPSFSLYPSSGTYYVGCDSIEVDMLINTDNTETDSANIIVTYTPADLDVIDQNGGTAGTQVTAGSVYSSYAGNETDETTGRIQLTGFNVGSTYNSGTNYTVFGTIDFDVIGAGTSNVTVLMDPADPPNDSNIAETITSNDILNDVEGATFTLLNDNVNPYIDSQSPAAGTTGVGINNNITFRFKDNECGVDLSTLSVTVDGIVYTQSGGNTFSASGNANNYLITVNPSYGFDYGETINITIAGDDVDGNSLSTGYSFTTIEDNDSPSISNKNPADLATDVPISQNIVFDITDTVSGVDLTSLNISVQGSGVTSPFPLTTYTVAGDDTFSSTLSGSTYTITVNPSTNFSYGETVSISILGSDNNGNSVLSNYSYTTIDDSTPPAISNLLPADQATSVSTTSNITFDVADTISGVDINTLQVAINGIIYTKSGNNAFAYSGTGVSYSITVDPVVEFTRGGTVSSVINVADIEGNTMPTYISTFDVIDNAAPTLTLIGDKSTNEGNLLTFLVEAGDSDGDTVSISMSSATLPAAATLTTVNSGTEIFSWTPGSSDSGTYVVTFTAADDGPDTPEDTETITITVNDVPAGPNTPPDLTPLINKTLYVGQSQSYLLSATDSDGDTITLTAVDQDSDSLTISDISNGLGTLTIDTDNLDLGSNIITVTATDDGAGTLSDAATFTVTVIELPGISTTAAAPVLQNPGNLNLYDDQQITILLQADDANNDTIVLSASSTSAEALTLTSITGGLATLNIDADKLEIGVNTITINAIDDSADTLSDSATFTVTVTALPSSITNTVTVTIPASCPATTSNSSNYNLGGYTGDMAMKQYLEKKAARENASTTDTDQSEEDFFEEITNSDESYSVAQVRYILDKFKIPPQNNNIALSCPETETKYVNLLAYAEQVDQHKKIEDDLIERANASTYAQNPDENDPIKLVGIVPEKDTRGVSRKHPIVAILEDDNGIKTDSLILRVNDQPVDFDLEKLNLQDYNRYIISYTPQNSYPANEEIKIGILAQDFDTDGGVNPEPSSFYSKFTTKEHDSSVTAVQPSTTTQLANINFKKVKVQEIKDRINITGSIDQPAMVSAKWKSHNDRATVYKEIAGQAFSINAPIDFKDGNYIVTLQAQAIDGLMSAPVEIEFVILDNHLSSLKKLQKEILKESKQGMLKLKNKLGISLTKSLFMTLPILLLAIIIAVILYRKH